MDMRKLVGDNLKQIRLEKGLTQEALAEVSGFTQQYISTVENGHANPTIVTIYEIAISMGAHYLDLLRPPLRQPRR